MNELMTLDYSYWVHLFLFPFVRIMALVSSAPLTGEREVPARIKIGLSVLITLLVAPIQQPESLTVFSPGGIWVIAQQVIIGVAMGMTMQFAFITIRFAGEVIGMQMGLSFATFFDPSGGPNTPILARILNVLALLLFLSFDGHLWLISALSQSFELLPIAVDPLSGEGFLYLVQASGFIFLDGLTFALPMVTLLLAINITLGLLNKMTPQLSIFVVGFPLTLLVGTMTLSLLLPHLAPYTERVFYFFFEQLAVIIERMNPFYVMSP